MPDPCFLPHLRPEHAAPIPTAGDGVWTSQGGGVSTLAKYADALRVDQAGIRAERLKSVPTPWARLLLFEQALFEPRHPVHAQVLSEWRGLLGCLALAEYLQVVVRAVAVSLDRANGSVKALRQMAPAEGDSSLWDTLALIYVEGALVGGTSPRTLVFTGMRNTVPSDVPFQDAGRFRDPTAYYRGLESPQPALALLHRWLGEVIKDMRGDLSPLDAYLGARSNTQDAATTSRAGAVLRLLQDWADQTGEAVDATGSAAAIDGYNESILGNVFPGNHPAASVYTHVRPIRARIDTQDRGDMYVDDADVIVDPGTRGILLRQGQLYTGNVRLPRGQTRSTRAGRFESPVVKANLGSNAAVNFADLFESTLIRVAEVNDSMAVALPAGEDEYLFPFKPEILQHVSPAQLQAWTRISGDAAGGIRIQLDVPVQRDLVVRYEQAYSSRDISDAPTPDLAVWPDFESPSWTRYLFVVNRISKDALTFSPVGETLNQADDGGRVYWGLMSAPARGWQGRSGPHQGLLLTRPLPHVDPPQSDWDIAIDFGSTHTRAFRAQRGVAGGSTSTPIEFRPRASILLGSAAKLPFSFFISPGNNIANTEEPPSLIWLPLHHPTRVQEQWLPTAGVIFWQSSLNAPETGDLRGNLKWHRDNTDDLPAFQSYISQLYLGIAAEAAVAGARIRSITSAYPSVFPNYLRNRHANEWGELGRRFNVEVRAPIAESAAVARYLVEQKGATATTNLLAIDIGGSTSDLAIWARGQQMGGDSIRLAGDVLARLVRTDAGAREAIGTAARRAPLNIDSLRWSAEGNETDGLVFNSLLRSIARTTSIDHLARNMYQGPNSPGERIIAHLAYMFAVVSYTLGRMAQWQQLTGDHFDIYFAGRGSQLLTWLDVLEDGACRALPEAFFRAGFGSEPSGYQTRLTPPGSDAKEEVGRGLLAPSIGDGATARERTTFLGESGFQGATGELPWNAVLTFDSLREMQCPTEPTAIENLPVLCGFIETFKTNAAAQVVARALHMDPRTLVADRVLRNKLHNSLFGPHSAWATSQRPDVTVDQSLLEPFFVTEAKVLLEHLTNNHSLFAE